MSYEAGETRVPVRLKGGRRAYLELPPNLSREDADEIIRFVEIQIEPEKAKEVTK